MIENLNREEVFGAFYEKNCKRQVKQILELKKQSREKAIKYMLNDNSFNNWIDKKDIVT